MIELPALLFFFFNAPQFLQGTKARVVISKNTKKEETQLGYKLENCVQRATVNNNNQQQQRNNYQTNQLPCKVAHVWLALVKRKLTRLLPTGWSQKPDQHPAPFSNKLGGRQETRLERDAYTAGTFQKTLLGFVNS